jgi:hypothetical protein
MCVLTFQTAIYFHHLLSFVQNFNPSTHCIKKLTTAKKMVSRDDQSEAYLNSDAVGDEFFIAIVEHKLKISRDKFKLRLVLLQPATGKNENFVSVVYRAKVKVELLETGERQSVDVILKVLLTTMELLKKFSVFPRERFIYDDVIASFEAIWQERAGETVKFGPDFIKSETDPYEIIVLDDLKAQQYSMLDRKIGLQLTHTKLALEKLAKFHAASAIRYQKVSDFHYFLRYFNTFHVQIGWNHSNILQPEGLNHTRNDVGR